MPGAIERIAVNFASSALEPAARFAVEPERLQLDPICNLLTT
jgi:hypothetical protein